MNRSTLPSSPAASGLLDIHALGQSASPAHAEETSRFFSNDVLFQNAFTSAAIGMALVGLDGQWLKVNAALCDIVGYSEQELLQTTFQAITHPDDLDTDLNFARQLFAGEIRSYQMEKRYFHKTGRVVWILLNVSCVLSRSGHPLFAIAQVLDITSRKAMEQELQSRNAELTEALHQVKQLQGILPICMYCKSVRDDENYWHRVETYVAKHSAASFSHGVCPTCLKKHETELIPRPSK